MLGENIFYASCMSHLLQANNNLDGGMVYAYHLRDPERYGVVEFEANNNVISIEEKPKVPKIPYTFTTTRWWR